MSSDRVVKHTDVSRIPDATYGGVSMMQRQYFSSALMFVEFEVMRHYAAWQAHRKNSLVTNNI